MNNLTFENKGRKPHLYLIWNLESGRAISSPPPRRCPPLTPLAIVKPLPPRHLFLPFGSCPPLICSYLVLATYNLLLLAPTPSLYYPSPSSHFIFHIHSTFNCTLSLLPFEFLFLTFIFNCTPTYYPSSFEISFNLLIFTFHCLDFYFISFNFHLHIYVTHFIHFGIFWHSQFHLAKAPSPFYLAHFKYFLDIHFDIS